MKFTVTFTKEEKELIIDTLETNGVELVEDKDEQNSAKYGDFSYSKDNNKIEINLNTSFVLATVNLILKFKNAIDLLGISVDNFTKTWFHGKEK